MKKLLVFVSILLLASFGDAQTRKIGGGSSSGTITAGVTATASCTDNAFMVSRSNLVACNTLATLTSTGATSWLPSSQGMSHTWVGHSGAVDTYNAKFENEFATTNGTQLRLGRTDTDAASFLYNNPVASKAGFSYLRKVNAAGTVTGGQLTIGSTSAEFAFSAGASLLTTVTFGSTGGLTLGTATRPTCDSSVRGTFWYVAGGAAVADTVAVCAKDGADAYAWRTIY